MSEYQEIYWEYTRKKTRKYQEITMKGLGMNKDGTGKVPGKYKKKMENFQESTWKELEKYTKKYGESAGKVHKNPTYGDTKSLDVCR